MLCCHYISQKTGKGDALRKEKKYLLTFVAASTKVWRLAIRNSPVLSFKKATVATDEPSVVLSFIEA